MADRPGASGANIIPEVVNAITDLIGSEDGFVNLVEVVRTNPGIQSDIIAALRSVSDRRVAADLRVISVSILTFFFIKLLL